MMPGCNLSLHPASPKRQVLQHRHTNLRGLPVWRSTCTFTSVTDQCFSKAYETGLRRTISFLQSRGVERDAAADVGQWAWIRGWERLELLRDDSVVLSWINAIAWNRYRYIARSRHLEEPLTDVNHGKCESNLAAIDVHRILETCQPHHRTLFEAHLLGYTTREIGQRLGISETAVRVRMLRARRSVRSLLGLDTAADAA